MNPRPVLFVLLSCFCACQAITRADDYEVAEAQADEPLCAQCPGRPDLRRPACAPQPPTADGEEIAFFAMRSFDVGLNAAGWSEGFLVGIDQDCSDRPDGRPVLCAPKDPQTEFERLANGVDNALVTEVLHPVMRQVGADTLTQINGFLELAVGGVILVLDGWNGQPNDERVGVRLIPAFKVWDPDPAKDSGLAKWDGTDEWIAYADQWDSAFSARQVPDTPNKADTGYVVDGELVWDARSLPAFLLPFGFAGAMVELRLSNVVLVGRLLTDRTPRLAENVVLAGVWSAFLAGRDGRALAELIALCNQRQASEIVPVMEVFIAKAPDMRTPTSTGATCDGISVGFLGNYVEIAGVREIAPISTIPNSCE